MENVHEFLYVGISAPTCAPQHGCSLERESMHHEAKPSPKPSRRRVVFGLQELDRTQKSMEVVEHNGAAWNWASATTPLCRATWTQADGLMKCALLAASLAGDAATGDHGKREPCIDAQVRAKLDVVRAMHERRFSCVRPAERPCK